LIGITLSLVKLQRVRRTRQGLVGDTAARHAWSKSRPSPRAFHGWAFPYFEGIF
jgi:hypothetical protein